MTTSMSTVKISTKDVFESAQKIEEAVKDYPIAQVYMSCLFVASLAMNPEMSPDNLTRMIKETSRFMHMMDAGEDTTNMVVN